MGSRVRAVLSLTLFVALIATVRPAAAQDLGESIKVERHTFRVTLSGHTYNIAGYLYYQGSYRERPLQVLVHGATYNHTYWDFPSVNGQDYSYARYMAARHYAVLAIDQLGTGASDKPDGFFINLFTTGESIRQILTSLRTTANPLGYAFEQIALVGHSAGAINAIYVQGQSHPADALVVTAARHLVPPLAPPPGLVDLALFLVTQPYFKLGPIGVRELLFYYPPSIDPDVAALDMSLEDFWTGGQVGTTFFSFLDPSIDQVHAVTGPALVQLGEFDALFPAGQDAIERALWGPAAELTIQTIAGTGHDFNLHAQREVSWRGIDEWLREALGFVKR